MGIILRVFWVEGMDWLWWIVCRLREFYVSSIARRRKLFLHLKVYLSFHAGVRFTIFDPYYALRRLRLSSGIPKIRGSPKANRNHQRVSVDIDETMGLYTILKKHRLKDRQLRLLFLGLDAAGKSTIVARLLSPDASPESALKDISPTLGFKISTIAFENYKLNICMLTTGCPDSRGCGRSKDSKSVLEELL